MTKTEAKPAIVAVNELFAKSADGLREIVRAVMQEMLEAEMTDALAAGMVKAITEELCGHSFSASAISAINKRLDASLDAFANRPLAEPFPYLILDARYEKVREGGVVMGQAVLIAIGIDWDGRRQILAVAMANRESRSSWKDFLVGLRRRGLHGVEFVVADDHAGLRSAVREVLTEAAFQRCYVHFLPNALDPLPRKADDDCLQELRWLYDRRSIEEARQDLAAWIAKWAPAIPNSSDGSKKPSKRRSPSTGSRASIISISRAHLKEHKKTHLRQAA